MDIFLRIARGDRQGESIPVPQGARIVVGRDISCDLQLFDDGLSREHMSIEASSSAVRITDLGSSNGTFVNGRRVQSAELRPGDRIRVGDIQIVIESASAASPPARRAPRRKSEALGRTVKKRFKATAEGLMELTALREQAEKSRSLAKHLKAIYMVSTIVNASEDLVGVTDSLVDTVHEIFEADRTLLFLGRAGNGAPEPVVTRSAAREPTTGFSTMLVEDVLRDGHSLLTTDATRDDRYMSKFSVVLDQIRAVMCVPIEAMDEILGAFYVDTARSTAFTTDDLELLAAIGRLTGIAMRRTQLIADRWKVEADLREKEIQLQQAQKLEAVGRLSAGVAHDFNNLLAVITGHCDLALLDMGDEGPIHESVTEIRAASERASTLTQQLLAFSRKQVLEPRIVDLRGLVSGMQRMIARLIGEDVELATSLADDLGSVRADPGQIQQVVLNLAVNARDAMPRGGKLVVECRNVDLGRDAPEHVGVEPGSYVLLAVSDTGTGMDRETCSRIFEPFFTTKEPGKGTGLGLSTAHGIVKQSGGEIIVYSEPGHGTTFKIYMPRVDGAPAETAPRISGITTVTGTETILVVEDDHPLLAMVTRMLEMRGYRVLAAPGGDEAIDLFHRLKRKVDLLVADVVMPRMSGPDLAARLHADNPDLRVIYMSGYSDEAIVHHGFLREGLAFLQKPFTADMLLRKVREVLE
jgi:signal transduction histidine kinase